MSRLEELARKAAGNGCKVLTAEEYAERGWNPYDDQPAVANPLHPDGRTEAANARRLIAVYGDRMRYCPMWDKWVWYDDRRWAVDRACAIEAAAKETAAELWNDVREAIGRADESTMKSLMGFAKSSNAAAGIRNMLTLARSEPGIPILPEQLDSHPWLLNCANGTLDLRTGVLREHRQEDYITKLCPVAFDPNADCPTWRRVVAEILPAEGLAGYLQRLIGYSATGLTIEHILPFFYGAGANGKSLVLNTLQEVLGADYAMKAPPDLLMSKGGQSHPTERADLFGKRFVACIESDDGRQMAEALVKELTGGDKVRARRMREDFWEFTPSHTIFLAANHKPVIKGQDHGIWRRVKLIPFTVTIPEERQDKQLPEKLLAEAPGILAWIVAGCRDWQAGGLREPAIVTEATQAYRADSDLMGQWLSECCLMGDAYTTTAKALLDSFRDWGGDMSAVDFGKALRERGFDDGRITKGSGKGRKAWRGIGLLAEGIE